MTTPNQMPEGGVDSANGGHPIQPQANPTATWLPIMRLGQGQPGVFTDARGMIAGEPATLTAKDVASSAGGIAQAMTGAIAGAVAGATQGSEIGAQEAGSLPTGGTDSTSGGPNAQGGNVGSKPAPAAGSQAQREANLNNAYSQLGMTNPDPSVP